MGFLGRILVRTFGIENQQEIPNRRTSHRSQANAYCLRCGYGIERFDKPRPFCYEPCWERFLEMYGRDGDELIEAAFREEQSFCHRCGQRARTFYHEPLCWGCS